MPSRQREWLDQEVENDLFVEAFGDVPENLESFKCQMFCVPVRCGLAVFFHHVEILFLYAGMVFSTLGEVGSQFFHHMGFLVVMLIS